MGNEVIQQRSGHVNPIVGVGDGLQLNTDEEPSGVPFCMGKISWLLWIPVVLLK